MIRILADEKVLFADPLLALGGRAELTLAPAAEITRERLLSLGVQALVVRSTIRVDEDLLAGSPVEFVGSATIGTDHVDLAHLARAGIAFAAAPGSSADSVAQFTVALLAIAACRRDQRLSGATLAVVGCGAIGSRVARAAERLGMTVLRHDPPLAEAGGRGFVDREALAEADYLSLHVPLESTGPHPTRRLVDDRFLAGLRKRPVLINTSRGEVVDEEALARALDTGGLGGAVLDVFVGEPRPDPLLLRRISIASPHVAGRSLEGLAANTRVVARALARHFGAPDPESPALPPAPILDLPGDAGPAELARRAWDLESVSESLRGDPSRFLELRDRLPLRRDLGRHGGEAAARFAALFD